MGCTKSIIGTVVGGPIGLMVGGQMDAADAQAKGVKAAAAASAQGTADSIAESRRQYNQTRDDFAPFRNLAPRSLATLESSVYGTPQSYADPSYQNLSDTEAVQQLYAKIQSGEVPANEDFWKDINNGENPLSRIMRDTNLASMTQGYAKGADGKIIKQADIPQLQANGQQFDLAGFKPENTAAFDWQKSRTLEDLGNYFNLVGRGRGSTVQSNTTGRALGDLNAAEYDKGYQRLFQRKQDYTNDLLNLVKTAQGAAGTTAVAGGETSRDITGAIRYGADSAANASLAQGQNKSNLYSGISQMPMQLAGLAVQGGFKPFA